MFMLTHTELLVWSLRTPQVKSILDYGRLSYILYTLVLSTCAYQDTNNKQVLKINEWCA